MSVIRKRYDAFVRKYNCEPCYVSATIKWKDDGEEYSDVVFKLSHGADEYDDVIFCYTDGIHDIETLADKRINGEEFFILRKTVKFLTNINDWL